MALDWAPFSALGTPVSFGLRRVDSFEGKRITVLEGNGTEERMYREVIYWLDEDDRLVARYDPAEECDTAMSAQDYNTGTERQ